MRLAAVRVAAADLVTVAVASVASSTTESAMASAATTACLRPVVIVALAERWMSVADLRTVVTAPLPRAKVASACATRSLVDFWVRTRLTSFSPRAATVS